MSTAAPALTQANPVIGTDTDAAGIDTIIGDIAHLLIQEGARIDQDLMVVERSGHLALASLTGEPKTRFIDLPTHALVPVDSLTWDDDAATVCLAEGAETLTGRQHTLLDLHIALWNATGKLAAFRDAHPRVAALLDPQLRDAITKIRPGFTPGNTTRDMLRTRTFSLRSGESSASVVMPILELADHHPFGAPYTLVDGHLGANYSFVDDTGLSYVRYGPHRDAIDLACLYGYATDFTTFFVSAPMTLDLQGFGTLTIERSVQRHAAPTWRAEEGILRINYLLLDAFTGLFDALHHPVREFLLTQGASRSQALSLAIDTAEMIMHANNQRLNDLIVAAERVPHQGASTIALAAAHQRAVIDVVGELA